MKRESNITGSPLKFAFLTLLIVAATGLASAPEAQAALRIQASLNAPVRATVVIGDGMRLCTTPKPYQRRTVVVRGCDCERDRHDRAVIKHSHKHRRHHQPRQVWVEGHWEQVSARTARWVPGHWERI